MVHHVKNVVGHLKNVPGHVRGMLHHLFHVADHLRAQADHQKNMVCHLPDPVRHVRNVERHVKKVERDSPGIAVGRIEGGWFNRSVNSRTQRAFTWITVALLASSCGKPSGGSAPSPGTYRGSYLGCSEVIVLNSNGFFTQTLNYPSASFTNTGSWKFEIRRAQNKVVFDQFLVAVDTINETSFNPPKMFSFYDGDWVHDRKRIEFRVESRYFVERMDP